MWRVAYLAMLAVLAFNVTAKEQATCLPDAMRLCSSELMSRDPDSIKACIQKNRAKLSLDCELVLRKRGM